MCVDSFGNIEMQSRQSGTLDCSNCYGKAALRASRVDLRRSSSKRPGDVMRLRRRLIVRPALRVEQDPAHPLYLFTLTGEELLSIAAISRLSRNGVGKLLGYQRPEMKTHIRN